MWVIKQQSKKNTGGIAVSGPIETQSGADELLKLYQKQAREAEDFTENPKHYFIAQHIKRGKKA